MGGSESRMKWTDEQLDALHAELKEIREELKKTVSIQYVNKTATRLYGNALDIAKQVTTDVATQVYGFGLLGFWIRPGHPGHDTYVNYMGPRLQSARAGITAADTVEKVLEIYRSFTRECESYIEALLQSERSR